MTIQIMIFKVPGCDVFVRHICLAAARPATVLKKNASQDLFRHFYVL